MKLLKIDFFHSGNLLTEMEHKRKFAEDWISLNVKVKSDDNIGCRANFQRYKQDPEFEKNVVQWMDSAAEEINGARENYEEKTLCADLRVLSLEQLAEEKKLLSRWTTLKHKARLKEYNPEGDHLTTDHDRDFVNLSLQVSR